MVLPSSHRCSDLAATGSLAAAVAEHLKIGDVVLLDGPIGAGKTHFVSALAAALGSSDQVTSPTYTIMHYYEASAGQLLHVDAYRLSGIGEYRDLGMDELAPEAITAVEWGERVAGAHPEHLSLRFAFVAGDDDARSVTIKASGSRWQSVVGTTQEAT
tara:strand:- start:38 stop:511 length:474 start_codon:yes stop_codon:yes gene_type:complete